MPLARARDATVMDTTSADVRRAFLEFFRQRGHEVVQSGPLVPPNDPTLLFANAGMVQFKDVFTGRERRAYQRATSSQKCIRISGKHNDLEAVGPSPRHHTFFEMLGNFSFGDYFKREAIEFAWEFLTQTLQLDPGRLVVTYFKGEDQIATDEQARDLWRQISGLPENRILGLGLSDNFWQMGETGPCGPSSEIYYCHGEHTDLSKFGQEQTPEGFGWVEIWNLVFMQFERALGEDGPRLSPLPAPSIDTGAGLERLCGAVQGKASNYDVDLLRELVECAAKLADRPYGSSMSADDVSMRVIADHARTAAFLIAEGILPDRTGRPYVLRRVIRRAVRHGHRLGIERPFLHEVTEQVVQLMGENYRELRDRAELIASIVEQEEVRFRATIERGLSVLEQRFEEMARSGAHTLRGADAFQLHDTFGFPLDLTQVICSERGVTVDVEGYEAALGEARARSDFRGADQAVQGVYHEALERVGPDGVRFVGYERDLASSTIVTIVRGGQLVEQAVEGDECEVVVKETPFYAESGGQVGDRGTIETENATVDVTDTQKPLAGLWIHCGRVRRGELRVGDTARLGIDIERRGDIRRNHSATHLLHLALRRHLGAHAQQKGSVVAPDRLRFDFTHDNPISPEQVAIIEDFVNQRILDDHPIRTQVLDMESARRKGATMIFEEKYGDTVRMLTMAESIELCGGTHARSTGEIGLFKVVSEQGVAAGVRRVVAVTGRGALAHVRQLESRLERAAVAVKATPADLVDKVTKLLERQRQLEKQVEAMVRQSVLNPGGALQDLLAQARELDGFRALAARTSVADRGALRELAEQVRDRLGDSVVLLGSIAEGKAQLVLTVAKSLTSRFSANDLIKPVAAVVGGSGGGRKDMAQAGGTQPDLLDQAFENLYTRLES